MTAAERQEQIMAYLFKARSATISYLVTRLGCSERTIRRDIEALTLRFPVETVRGRNGCVTLIEGYQPSFSTLNPDEIQALREAIELMADPKKRQILRGIACRFSPTR